MKKKSFDTSTWEKIKQKLLTLPDEGDPAISGAKSKLNTFKFEMVEKGPDGEPEAVAYVTGEDANNNGIVDTINIVSPKVEDTFKKLYQGKSTSQIDSIDKEQLRPFLKEIANTVLHEAKHLKGGPLKLDPTKPGGGFATEEEAKAAEHHSIDNKKAKRNFTMKKQQILDILSKLASDLKGKDKMAAREVNALIIKYAQESWSSPTRHFPSDYVDTASIETSGTRLTEDQIYEMREHPSSSPGVDRGVSDETPMASREIGQDEKIVKLPNDPYTYVYDSSRNQFKIHSKSDPSLPGRVGAYIMDSAADKKIREKYFAASGTLGSEYIYVPGQNLAAGTVMYLIGQGATNVPSGAAVGDLIVVSSKSPFGGGENAVSRIIKKDTPEYLEALQKSVDSGEFASQAKKAVFEKLLQNAKMKIQYSGTARQMGTKVEDTFEGIGQDKVLQVEGSFKDETLNKIASLKEQYAEVLTFEKRHPFGRNFKG